MEVKAVKEGEMVAEILGLTLSAEEKEILEKALADTKQRRLARALTFDFFGGAKVALDSLYVSPKQGKDALDFLASHP